MGVEVLRRCLKNHRTIALHTGIFIYHIEANTRYSWLTDLIFAWMERPQNRALTSTVTELLVRPYQQLDQPRIDEFHVLLTRYPNLEWIAPNLDIADLAAQLRALHRSRTPDALQAATAIQRAASGLITNEPVFSRVRSLHTLVLDHAL